ncbi:MAG TPA: 30S ribosomal protein S16 [Candidatus Saccharimonadales bacterium]|nr:30S ribosomal protein S16 [Candidatus Saccharimonadales bacterium]
MLVIRLARGGRSKYPVYRIVAAESSRAATSKFVEILGHYNPHTKELVIKKEETEKRLANGAQPSNSVAKLLQQEKIELPGWVKIKTRDRKPKKEPEVKEEAAPAPEAPAEVAAVEETPAEAPQEELVAQAATENAAEVEENAVPAGETETAEVTEEKPEAAEEASEAAAEAATPEAPAEEA